MITMAHGSGGKAMKDLIDAIFLDAFDNEELAKLDDQARFTLATLQAHGDRLALTTDSYVVFPIFFPGGDIGKLAVAGTVNDLAVGGAKPLYLTCSFILEEGLAVADLRRIVQSIKETALTAGVTIVTGDTKVVERGSADKIFINTAGIGVIASNIDLGPANARPGDVVLINGTIGDHGAAIVQARGDLAIDSNIQSDCRPLNSLIAAMLQICPHIRSLRDATRGGIATVLNEFAAASNMCFRIDETAIPLKSEVRGICEILGLDPYYLANEGKIVAVVPAEEAEAILACMRAHPDGKESAIIGEVMQTPENMVVLKTIFGGVKVLDMLVGDQLPRIC
ncbi:MAG: hydrogenase expression/formation protein HypE [Cyanobacteria bacterium REEB67]|nr:hydrogenase expression/formation protein HypE [Cyanobacteria bacterium REEB67]